MNWNRNIYVMMMRSGLRLWALGICPRLDGVLRSFEAAVSTTGLHAARRRIWSRADKEEMRYQRLTSLVRGWGVPGPHRQDIGGDATRRHAEHRQMRAKCASISVRWNAICPSAAFPTCPGLDVQEARRIVRTAKAAARTLLWQIYSRLWVPDFIIFGRIF